MTKAQRKLNADYHPDVNSFYGDHPDYPALNGAGFCATFVAVVSNEAGGGEYLPLIIRRWLVNSYDPVEQWENIIRLYGFPSDNKKAVEQILAVVRKRGKYQDIANTGREIIAKCRAEIARGRRSDSEALTTRLAI